MSTTGLIAMLAIGTPVIIGFSYLLANTKIGRKIDREIFPCGNDGWDDNTKP